MPAMIVWPVSSSALTVNVGSSSDSRWIAVPSFSWSPLVLGSIATSITGAGNVIDSRITGLLLVAQRVTGLGVLQAHDGHDLAGADRRDLLTLVGVHLVDLADPLLAAVDRVEHRGARLELAGVDADVDQLAEVRVGGDLVGQAGERLGRRTAAGRSTSSSSLTEWPWMRVDVERRGQVLHDRVEQGLDALVLERGAAQHRVDLVGQGGATDRGLELLDGELLALEVLLHDLVVGLGQRLEQLLAVLGGLLGQLARGSPRPRSPRPSWSRRARSGHACRPGRRHRGSRPRRRSGAAGPAGWS